MSKQKVERFTGEAITVSKNEKNQYEIIRIEIENGIVRHRHPLGPAGYTVLALDQGENYLRERLIYLDNGIK